MNEVINQPGAVPEQKSSNKVLWIVLGIVIGIFVLSGIVFLVSWNFTSSVMDDAGDSVEIVEMCLKSEAKPVSCVYNSVTNVAEVDVQLVRGDPVAIRVLVVDGLGSTKVGTAREFSSDNVASVQVDCSEFEDTTEPPYQVSAAAVVESGDGERTCDIGPAELPCEVV